MGSAAGWIFSFGLVVGLWLGVLFEPQLRGIVTDVDKATSETGWQEPN